MHDLDAAAHWIKEYMPWSLVVSLMLGVLGAWTYQFAANEIAHREPTSGFIEAAVIGGIAGVASALVLALRQR